MTARLMVTEGNNNDIFKARIFARRQMRYHHTVLNKNILSYHLKRPAKCQVSAGQLAWLFHTTQPDHWRKSSDLQGLSWCAEHVAATVKQFTSYSTLDYVYRVGQKNRTVFDGE